MICISGYLCARWSLCSFEYVIVVAFETDLPRIEFDTTPGCQRHLSNPADPDPGQGCVNPPGAKFYPIYSTRFDSEGCLWQIGGPFIPGTLEDFGGNSTTEYGELLALFYPAANGQPQYIYEDFHRGLPYNPCLSNGVALQSGGCSHWASLQGRRESPFVMFFAGHNSLISRPSQRVKLPGYTNYLPN